MAASKKIDEKGIRECMADAWGLPAEAVPADAQLNKFMPWDSMGHVSMMLALEERYGVEANFDTINLLTSVSAILQYLRLNLDGPVA